MENDPISSEFLSVKNISHSGETCGMMWEIKITASPLKAEHIKNDGS